MPMFLNPPPQRIRITREDFVITDEVLVRVDPTAEDVADVRSLLQNLLPGKLQSLAPLLFGDLLRRECRFSLARVGRRHLLLLLNRLALPATRHRRILVLPQVSNYLRASAVRAD